MADEDTDIPFTDGNLPAGVQIRLHKLAEQRNAAREEAASIRAAFDAFKGEVEQERTGWEAERNELAPFKDRVAELEQAQSNWQSEKAIVQAGIRDEEGIEFARLAYNRIPEEERPKGGLGEWLSEDNRENLPRAVTAYFGEESTKTTTHVDPNRGARPEQRTARNGQTGSYAERRAAIFEEMGQDVPAYNTGKA